MNKLFHNDEIFLSNFYYLPLHPCEAALKQSTFYKNRNKGDLASIFGASL